MEKSVASHLWAATAGVVDVVALHGDHVVGAEEVDSPVVVVVASGGPAGVSIKLGVGNGDTTGCGGSSDEVLTTDEGNLSMSITIGFKSIEDSTYLDVINPDEISAGKSDGITSPDVLWVQLSDVNVSSSWLA